MAKQKRTNYLIKEQALNKTINDALKLKDDLNNFSSFKDHSTNQLFFVCTSEQLYKVLDKFKSDLDLNKNIYLEDLKNLLGFAMQLKMHDRYERLICQIRSMIKERENFK